MTPPAALSRHLAGWLGKWPGSGTLEVVGSFRREEPAWDGALHPVMGVLSTAGGVLSVPPAVAREVRALIDRAPREWRERLPEVVGYPGRSVVETAYRFTDQPPGLPDVGRWMACTDPALPSWLAPFGGEALVCTDENGRYLAGVGIKRHDRLGHELAVGTEPHVRGAGLARMLVAQAARAVVAGGAVAIYRHELGNVASARVADAAGFVDRGWRAVMLN